MKKIMAVLCTFTLLIGFTSPIFATDLNKSNGNETELNDFFVIEDIEEFEPISLQEVSDYSIFNAYSSELSEDMFPEIILIELEQIPIEETEEFYLQNGIQAYSDEAYLNTETFAMRANLPDIRVYDLVTLGQEPLRLNYDEYFAVSVANFGNVDVNKDLKLDLYMGTTYHKSFTIPASMLTSMTMVRAQFTVAGKNAGIGTITAECKTRGIIVETNYDDNIISRTFTWGGATNGNVDLAFYQIVNGSNPNADLGDTLEGDVAILVMVSNQGNAYALDVPVNVSVSQKIGQSSPQSSDINYVIDSIPPNKIAGFIIRGRFLYHHSTITFNVTADPNRVMQDINYSNNQGSRVFEALNLNPDLVEYSNWYWPNKELNRITTFHGSYPGGGTHYGVDIVKKGQTGTKRLPQRAVSDGTVVWVGEQFYTGYAIVYELKQLHWETKEKPCVVHMHFDEHTTLDIGSNVFGGETIVGLTGTTGFGSTNDHMHLEVRKYGLSEDLWNGPVSLTDDPFNFFYDLSFLSSAYSSSTYGYNTNREEIESYCIENATYPQSFYFLPKTLLDYIGNDTAKEWLNEQPEDSWNVIDIAEHFELSKEEIAEIYKDEVIYDLDEILSCMPN